ncbi:MAG: holo-ACP synthase [Bacteroidales bacterium]|nr:holo-ACP synthase [Bacteroidales bacterium]
MILGIGTDLFDVERMKNRLEKQPTFIDGVFTDNEIKYCNQFKNKAQRFAARYAAKEALLKALGTGWRNGITFKDINIVNDDLGKPGIELSGIAKQIADKLEVTSIHLSLSHTEKLANAFVIINNNK